MIIRPDTKAKLIKCDVKIDPDGNNYPTMHIQYLVETEYEKLLVDIPEAVLPLRPNRLTPDLDFYCISVGNNISYKIKLDDDVCCMIEANGELSDVKYAYAEKTLERYPRKMSIEEIENKLGYPIEIVSKKKGDIS